MGKQLIGLYLGKTSFGSTYGAAGSLVLVLVWVYYSAQIFFYGAEFTKVYADAHGSLSARKRKPKPDSPQQEHDWPASAASGNAALPPIMHPEKK